MISKRNILKVFSSFSILVLFNFTFYLRKDHVFYLEAILEKITISDYINLPHILLNKNDLKNIHEVIKIALNDLNNTSSKINTMSILSNITTRDFKNNDILNIDGWILSKSEITLIALKKEKYSGYRR